MSPVDYAIHSAQTRKERSKINAQARESGLNYGKYVGLNTYQGLSVEQEINIKKETGTFNYKTQAERQKERDESIRFLKETEALVLKKNVAPEIAKQLFEQARKKYRSIPINKDNLFAIMQHFKKEKPNAMRIYDEEEVEKTINIIMKELA